MAMRSPTHLIVLALAAATLLTSGCRRAVVRNDEGLQTGRVSDRRLANLRRIAARDTGCHEAMLEPRALDEGIYEVVGIGGCQAVRHYVMTCRHRYSCRWEEVPPLEAQAMTDLGCAPDSLWIRATSDPMARQVFACDVVVPYHLSCWAHGCAWAQAGPPTQATPPADAMEVTE